jgi:hypothetical protein
MLTPVGSFGVRGGRDRRIYPHRLYPVKHFGEFRESFVEFRGQSFVDKSFVDRLELALWPSPENKSARSGVCRR